MVVDFLAKAGPTLQPNEEMYFDHVEPSFEHLLYKDIKHVAIGGLLRILWYYFKCYLMFFPFKKKNKKQKKIKTFKFIFNVIIFFYFTWIKN